MDRTHPKELLDGRNQFLGASGPGGFDQDPVRARWLEFVGGNPTRHGLVVFHSQNKYLFLMHSAMWAARMGRSVAGVAKRPLEDVLEEYQEGMNAALREQPSKGKHANVMQHLAGFVSPRISPTDRMQLAASIGSYLKGAVPLEVPQRLLIEHLRDHQIVWALQQTYLDGVR